MGNSVVDLGVGPRANHIMLAGKRYDVTLYRYIRQAIDSETGAYSIEGRTGEHWNDETKTLVEIWERAPEIVR